MLVLRITRSDLQGWAVVVFTPQSRFFRRKRSLVLTAPPELGYVGRSPGGRLIFRSTSDDCCTAWGGWRSVGCTAAKSEEIRQPATLSGIGSDRRDEKDEPGTGHKAAHQPNTDDCHASWTDR